MELGIEAWVTAGCDFLYRTDMVNGAFVVHLSFCAHQFKISFACCEDTAYLIIKLALEKTSSCLLVFEEVQPESNFKRPKESSLVEKSSSRCRRCGALCLLHQYSSEGPCGATKLADSPSPQLAMISSWPLYRNLTSHVHDHCSISSREDSTGQRIEGSFVPVPQGPVTRVAKRVLSTKQAMRARSAYSLPGPLLPGD